MLVLPEKRIRSCHMNAPGEIGGIKKSNRSGNTRCDSSRMWRLSYNTTAWIYPSRTSPIRRCSGTENGGLPTMLIHIRCFGIIGGGSKMAPILGRGLSDMLFKKAGEVKLVAEAVFIADLGD